MLLCVSVCMCVYLFRAADWLFSHPDDLDFAVAQALGGGSGGGSGGAVAEVTAVDPLSQRGRLNNINGMTISLK